MRGLFNYQEKDTDTPRVIATVKTMSEREQSELSKCLCARDHNNGKNRRRMPCFVFGDDLSGSDDCGDFFLTLSNDTAFIDTRAKLSPGQRLTLLFPVLNNQEPVAIIGEVIWIHSKA